MSDCEYRAVVGWYRHVFYKHDVSACAAANFAHVEVGDVCVAGQHCGTGSVGDSVVQIGSEVVEELDHVGVCGLSERVLLLS